MFHLIRKNKRPCFWAEFPVTATLIPCYFLRSLVKTLINIGVQSLFGRYQVSKNKKFPVNFPVKSKKQGKHTLAK
jgi:hypothetical protein